MSSTQPPSALDVFEVLERGLDAMIESFKAVAVNVKPGELNLDGAGARRLTARLVRITTKLGGLERYAALALRGIVTARAAIGDPLTDTELEQACAGIHLGPMPVPFGAGSPPPVDAVLRPVEPPPGPARPTTSKDWN